MPFFDFNKTTPANLAAHDVVIIGAGAAGIFLAVKLSRAGRRVLLVESGHFDPDEQKQALNETDQQGKPLSDIWGRKRIIGGTTTAWGGQALPFQEMDFEPRDWVQNSGWPLNREILGPHYAEAEAFLRLDALNYDTELFPRLGSRDPGFAPERFHYHYSKWAPQPNFARLQASRLRSGVTVLYNAHLQRIDRGGMGEVTQVVLASFVGRQVTLGVRQLVIAAGGLESNRILLLNDHQHRGGIGNQSNWLGRAFMEHPALDIGTIHHADEKTVQRVFATRLWRLRKYAARLSASPEWQRRHRLLNVSAGFIFTYDSVASDPYFELREAVRQRQFGGLFRALRKSGPVARGLGTLAREGFLFKPGAQSWVCFQLEQEPCRESYIGLSSKCDRFGARLAQLHWHISPLSWRTAVRFAGDIKLEIERLGLGQVVFNRPLADDDPDWERRLSDVNHHMGGTRMSATAAEGVVTPDLAVWGMPNLYVCSTSVFPTSSHSNPTLTLLALAARLGDRLLRGAAGPAPAASPGPPPADPAN